MAVSKLRVVSAVAASFVVSNALAAIIHGFVLAADYDAFEGTLLRSEVARQMLLLPVAHLSFVGALTWVGTRVRLDGNLIARGFALGLLGWGIGQVPLWLLWYAEQPWPGSLVVKQLGLELVASVVIGLTIATVLRSRSRTAAPQPTARVAAH
jgi:hypothetical protein